MFLFFVATSSIWKLSRGVLKDTQWFLTYKCLNSVWNGGHWLGNLPACNLTITLSVSQYDRSW